MSDSVLSQDELDALLQGTSLENNDSNNLSKQEEAAIIGVFQNIGIAQANVLGQLLSTSVQFENVSILSGAKPKIIEDMTTTLVGNRSSITGNMTGTWAIVAPENTVLKVTNHMLSAESTEISNEVVVAFGEAISTLLASDVKVLSERLKTSLSPSLVETQRYDNGDAFIDGSGALSRVALHVNIDGASYTYYIVSSINFMKNIAKILSPASPESSQTTQSNNNTMNSTINMTPAQFQQFSPTAQVEPLDNLALLLDVPMRVTVELGRTRMTIKDILNLGEGSIVELEKLAGEPVDVLVNDKLIALGEVVVIDENFSVRVTKVVTPMERIFDRENLHGKGGV